MVTTRNQIIRSSDVIDNEVYNSKQEALEIEYAYSGSRISGNTFRGMWTNQSNYSSSDYYKGIYVGGFNGDFTNNVIDSSYNVGLYYLMSNGRIDSNTVTNNGTGIMIVGNFDSKITSQVGYNNITNNV